MNQRRQAFCEAYLASGNATEAAREAGYSPRSARSQGQRLLTFADIQEYLAARNQEISAASTAQVEESRQFWTATMRDKGAKTGDRLKASELLAKTYGAFLDRAYEELSVTDTVYAWIESIPDAPGENVLGQEGVKQNED